MTSELQSPSEILDQLQKAAPASGLFADHQWLQTPEPFPLQPDLVEDLKTLGHRLLNFQRAADLLYRQSVSGKQPEWIARCLDAGKPEALLGVARSPAFRDRLPAVLRPDLLLTEQGFTITELDSVPGGIGLTDWLNTTYSDIGFTEIIGGASGMRNGFRSILPDGADIIVSEESATYRPEMDYLASKLGEQGDAPWRVIDPSEARAGGAPFYRFFELFDVPNLPGISDLLAALAHGEADGPTSMTAPPKPWLEEKLNFALFWSRPLQGYWRRALRENHWLELRKYIPRSWIMDPSPIPHHAVLPGLEIQDWNDLGSFSQKERNLVIKVSGFSDQAWGSRGVTIGPDVAQQVWSNKVREALDAFPTSPHVLQEFAPTRLVDHPYFDPSTGEVKRMRGRVRLCPYYFVADGTATLGGVLATIVPADKKIIHGMRDAIICPCRAA